MSLPSTHSSTARVSVSGINDTSGSPSFTSSAPGAACNRRIVPLRRAVTGLCEERGIRLKLVPLPLCTDNAAMIGAAAAHTEPIAWPGYLDFDAFATGDRR